VRVVMISGSIWSSMTAAHLPIGFLEGGGTSPARETVAAGARRRSCRRVQCSATRYWVTSALLADELGRARRCGLYGGEEARHEGSEIGESVGSRAEHHDGDRERDYVLLKEQVSIHCYEHVELSGSEGKQLSILERRPSHLTRGLHLMGGEFTTEAPVNTLVEQYPHETISISRSFASSRKAITCSRVTDGNPSRKSSIVSPPSM